MRFVLFLVTSLAGVALAEEQQAPYWLAKAKVKCDSKTYNCLGAIIEDNFLITTASCINKCNSLRGVKISVSKYSTNGGKQFGKKVKPTEVTVHPEYSQSETQKMHDLALVKFKCPKFKLAKASINDSRITKGHYSIIHVNQTTGDYSTYEASLAGRKKKCKQAYENWDDSQQVCIVASSCLDKSESLITDDHQNVLYGLPVYASLCDNNNNGIIAAVEIRKYHEWITNKITTTRRCRSRSPKPPTPPHQIVTDQPTTTTTTTNPTSSTTTPSVISVTTPTTSSTPSTLSCSDPPLPLKMNVVIPESLTEGAMAKYSCPDRYELVGDNVLTCKNGKWAGDKPYCKDCPEFGTVSNGRVVVTLNVTSHLSIQIKCDEGHEINGETFNHCDKGKWKHSKATCEAIKCPIPKSIPNGSVRTTGLTFTHLAIYQCNNGYLLSGFQKRQCKSDGTWTGTPPTCIQQNRLLCKQYDRISCGSTANSGGLSIGATVTYTPNSNAQLMGASKITCLSNGSWSAPTPVCRMMCPMSFNLENGDYKLIMNDDTPDYEMEMTCEEGFEMTGVNKFTCKNGLWNRIPSQTKCHKGCKCPEVKNATVKCTKSSDFLFVGVTCKAGYKIQGGSTGVCRHNVYLSPLPTCVIKD